MSREITTHKGGVLNDAITITADGLPTAGGAHRSYTIKRPSEENWKTTSIDLLFQDGNPANKINGISNECLLAVVRDRLEGFQRGAFACDDNGLALEHVTRAMGYLMARTRERQDRGVEGQQVQ